jgi:hypothetical protein
MISHFFIFHSSFPQERAYATKMEPPRTALAA